VGGLWLRRGEKENNGRAWGGGGGRSRVCAGQVLAMFIILMSYYVVSLIVLFWPKSSLPVHRPTFALGLCFHEISLFLCSFYRIRHSVIGLIAFESVLTVSKFGSNPRWRM